MRANGPMSSSGMGQTGHLGLASVPPSRKRAAVELHSISCSCALPSLRLVCPSLSPSRVPFPLSVSCALPSLRLVPAIADYDSGQPFQMVSLPALNPLSSNLSSSNITRLSNSSASGNGSLPSAHPAPASYQVAVYSDVGASGNQIMPFSVQAFCSGEKKIAGERGREARGLGARGMQ